MADGIRVYTPNQAAEVLQCTPRCIYSYLRKGVIPGRRIGGRWKILEDDLRKWIREGHPEPGAGDV